MNRAALLDEARRAWRELLRRPGALAIAVLTLALGVGTVTAVHALLHQALLRPLPFPDADRLVTLGIQVEPGEAIAAPRYYPPLRSMQSVESAGMMMSWPISANVATGDQASVVLALRADRGFVATLGLPMALGRNFDEAEDRPNGPSAVLISHAFWRSHFAGAASAVGASLQLEGRSVAVVGVLSPELHWPDRFDLILPLQPNLTDTDLSTNQLIVARLRPGATIAAAAAETDAALRAMLAADSGATDRQRAYVTDHRPTALALGDSVFARRTGDTLWMFLGAAGCVLLIAATNLASLMFLRVLARSHASAVRVALGASPAQLGVSPLAEGVLVGVLGAAGGLALAWLGLAVLGGLVPPEWLRGQPVQLGPASAGLALAGGIATAVLAAGFGVLRARRRDWARELSGGGRAGWSLQVRRLGRALVVAQVALAVVLLVGAALFGRSVQELESVPMGFASRGITTFTLSLLKERAAHASVAIDQTRRILERIERMPGVERAGASTNLPTASQLNFSMVLPNERKVTAQYRLTTPSFLDVFGIPLLAGRALGDADRTGAEPVCLVSASFARDYLASEPLDKIVTLPDVDGADLPMRVVGVVGDVRQFGPGEISPPTLYAPFAQIPPPLWAMLREFGPMSYAIKLAHGGSLGADEPALRAAIQEAAPAQPIAVPIPMDAIVASTIAKQRLHLLLVGLFAALALLLACVGLYAVTAVEVAARRHDLGVRAALGATRGRLLRGVLRDALSQIAIGLAIGLVVAIVLARVLGSFLFGVSAADPLAIAGVLITLAAAGVLASLVPAIRAARVPPMQALRVD